MKKFLSIITLLLLMSCHFFVGPVDKKREVQPGDLKLLWEVKYDMAGLGIKTAPLVLGDSLVIMSAGKDVFALEQSTGKIRWKYFVSNLTNTHSKNFRTDGERIFFTHVEDVRAISLKDGTEQWILPLPNERGAFNNENFILQNGKLYVPGYRTVYCINPINGSIEWATEIIKNRGTIGIPTYYKNKIIIFSSQGFDDSTTHAIAGIIHRYHVLDANNGDTLLTKQIKGDGLVESVAVENGILYGGTHFPWSNSCFYAFNLETNEMIWSYFLRNDGRDYTDCVIADDKVIARTGPTFVSAFNKNTGELLWIIHTIQIPEVGGLVRYYKGYIYHTQGGKLFIIDPNDGDILHSQYGPDNQSFETITIANDKVFVCGTPTLQCYEVYKP